MKKKPAPRVKKKSTVKVKTNPLKEKALKIVEFISNKQAIRPIILELAGLTTYCEYFVICSAESNTQVEAIADEVVRLCAQNKIKVHHYTKDETRSWILVDLFDVVVHIFTEEARDFYNLEYLWRDAKQVKGRGV